MRLVDVPLERRRAAARVVAALEPDPWRRLEVKAAAEEPSDNVYWIAA